MNTIWSIIGAVFLLLLSLLGIQTKRVGKQKEKVKEQKQETAKAEKKAEVAKVGQQVATEAINDTEQIEQKHTMQKAEIREAKDENEARKIYNSIIDNFNNGNKRL